MSRTAEPINADIIRTSADLTWQQHQPGGNSWQPGTCRQCTPNGCPQLTWATGVRSVHERRRSAQSGLPDPASSARVGS